MPLGGTMGALVAAAAALGAALLLAASGRHDDASCSLPGHGQPLGGWPRGEMADGGTAHRPAQGPVRTYTAADDAPPDAAAFWRSHVDPLQPALFKRMATRSPAMVRWSDGYLRERYGAQSVKVEYRREDRLSDYCGMIKRGVRVECPEFDDPWKAGLEQDRYLPLGSLLERWNDTAGTDEYVISSLPSVMRDDIAIPPTFLRGGAARHPAETNRGTPFYEANLWMSQSPPLVPPPPHARRHEPQPPPPEGEGLPFSSSVIHYDQNHQVMCLFDGVKEW